MIGLTIREIAAASGGHWTGEASLLDRTPNAIATDSRAVQPGDLFVAIRGERTDGHKFIPDVFARGALAVLCEEEGAAGEGRIIVPEVFEALRAAALFNRERRGIPVIGLTGSVGKTTAKEMLCAVLSRRYLTFKNPGSLNGQLGVPLSLMSVLPEHEIAVQEMAISLPGEMERIGRVAKPDAGIFMNIGDAHLEALHSRDGILREKLDMLISSPENAPVFLNGDDPLLAAHDFGPRPVTRFGLGAENDVRAEALMSADGGTAQSCLIVSGTRRFPVYIPAYGDYMVMAALAAASAAIHFSLTDEEIAAGIADYKTVGHRSRVLQLRHCTLIDDCYNANPTSNRAAIDSMARLPGRKVMIFGDMREMGEKSVKLHRELGEYAASHGAALILTQGGDAAYISEAAGELAHHFETKRELIEALPDYLRDGDTVLVKASHGPRFDEIVEAIEALNR